MIKHRTSRHRPMALATVLSCTLLLGCETTGNPREGGLFGWSEDKARQRQAALEAEGGAARKAADSEIRRGAALAAEQGQLRTEVSELRAHLARLIGENDKLAGEIRALMSKRQVGATELTRLRGTLVANEQARADARRAAEQAPSAQAAAQLSGHSENVSRHNQQLHREVLLLMGR